MCYTFASFLSSPLFSPTSFLCQSDHNSFSPFVHHLFPPFHINCLGVCTCNWVIYWGPWHLSLSVVYWHLSISVICWQLLYCLNEILSTISTTGPTSYTIYFQFITINSLYMFRALIYSSSGGAVCTTIGIFCAYYVGWQLKLQPC
jgi:hypothetical protein